MKRSKDLVNARRDKLLELIKKTGTVNVTQIAEHLKVSEITVRRDLQLLEDQKQIDRFYGGARLHSNVDRHNRDTLTICRENIARLAASFVEDGDTLFINTSSTALMMLQYITAKDITVITNNGNAVFAPKAQGVKVLLTGGELYNLKGTMVGEFAYNNLMKVSARKAFLGCTAINSENGMSTEILNEVDLNRAMFTRKQGKGYVLADHTKIGKISSFISCDIDLITDLITDDLADPAELQALRDKNVHVYTVNSKE